MIALWTCLVRLPFLHIVNDDEAFFSVVAARWLNGEIPYADSFDVKPPLLFAIFAAAQSLAGASLATIKGLEIVFTAAGAILLFRMVDRHGSRPVALWAGFLFPVYSLSLLGVNSANSVLQLPFIIAAFAFAMTAITAKGERLAAVFLAGLAIGLAGLVKQTALFEALALASFMLWHFRGARPIRALLAFTAGAAIPVIAFAGYFLWAGHFQEAFDAVVTSSLSRVSIDIPQYQGSKLVYLISAVRFVPLIKPLYFLALCSALALMRRKQMATSVPAPLANLAVLWFVSAAVGVITLHSMYPYAATVIPPLLILSGMLVMHGLVLNVRWRPATIGIYALVAAAVPLFVDRHDLAVNDLDGPDDFLAEQASSARLVELGIGPTDHILVLNRGLYAYILSGTLPAARYFHDMHLLGDFPTPDRAPLDMAFATRPRYVLLAEPRYTRIVENVDRLQEMRRRLDADYTLRAVTRGDWDGTLIYQIKRP